ncbi:hypothetical protein [Actinoplanes sp. NPDC049802]|uniref:hypothetical protein n=1 Tax=Actinoplanes sp. NPDC049802 TaxID=3154742 RepID=UPI003400AB34
MGILYDYFRAATPDVVVDLMDRNDAGSPASADGWPTPVVGLKAVDPAVVLGRLVGFIDPAVSTRDELVWPAGGEQDAEHMGPWVTVLDDRSRDALAGLDAARIPEIAGRWARIEEFGHYDDNTDEAAAETITELAGLARDARDSGERVYCWICL